MHHEDFSDQKRPKILKVARKGIRRSTIVVGAMLARGFKITYIIRQYSTAKGPHPRIE
jgi:hypothetical protein